MGASFRDSLKDKMSIVKSGFIGQYSIRLHVLDTRQFIVIVSYDQTRLNSFYFEWLDLVNAEKCFDNTCKIVESIISCERQKK